MRVISLLIVAIACLLGSIAEAAPVTLAYTWTTPTQNTDGSALLPSQITKYQIFAATAAIPDTVTGTPQAEPAGTVNSGTASVTANPGDTIYSRIRTCTVAGCGPLSNTVTKVVPALPLPNAPTGLTITITISLP